MSKTQINHNLKVKGGFLPLLAGLATQTMPILTSTALPALAAGALTGLASTGVNKMMGSGMGQKIYLKKEGSVEDVKDTNGRKESIKQMLSRVMTTK